MLIASRDFAFNKINMDINSFLLTLPSSYDSIKEVPKVF